MAPLNRLKKGPARLIYYCQPQVSYSRLDTQDFIESHFFVEHSLRKYAGDLGSVII